MDKTPIIKKKETKWVKRLFTVLLVIVIALGAPVAAVFLAFYDDTSTNKYVQNDDDMNTIFNRVVSNCLDDVGETEEVSFKITEQDFNQILVPQFNNMIGSIKEVNQFINAFYLDINETNYNFVFELKEEALKVFKSKVTLVTEMEHIQSEDINEDKIVFWIRDIVVGKISNLYSLGKKFLVDYDIGSYIEGFFTGSGLHVKVDVENNVIEYKTMDMVNDLFAMAGTDQGGFSTIFSSMVKTSIEHKQFNFDFYGDESLKLALNLSEYGFNNNYCYDGYETTGIDIHLDKHMQELRTLVDNNIISDDEIDQLLHYLIHGYEGTNITNKQKVEGLDLSCIGISDPTTYEGDELPEPIDLSKHVSNQLNALTLEDLTTNKHLASIDEITLNQMVSSTSIIGYSFLIPSHDEEGHSKITFVTVDKFYVNIQNDVLKAVCRININDFYSYLILEYNLQSDNTDYTKIILTPENHYFGTVEAPEELLSYFYMVIGEGFAELEESSFDPQTGEIVIDISHAFNNATNIDLILNYGTPVISLKGINLEEDGVISIDFN